jgi:nucleoid-associated protein YgaU
VTVPPPAAPAAPEAPNGSHATLPAGQILERTTAAKRANYTEMVARSAASTATAPDVPPPITRATTAAVDPEPPGEPGDRASPGRSSHQRFLTVRPGDSLWSIAKRLLGPDASSAQIARKVAQLWKLNGERIGTGRPDLLLVGTKLIVR